MPTDYDSIADQYRESKGAEWRVHIETPSFMQLVGEVSGKSVLDLACGEGFYSRRIKRQGAARVIGIDSSPAMIELARAADRSDRLGIDYLVADVRDLDLGERYDLVVAAYLLNYASSPAELVEMCQVIAQHLNPGCRFVTVNSNPETTSKKVDYRKYGFERLVPDDLHEGTPYLFRNYQGDTSFDITVYDLGRATHDRAFASVGLTDVRWLPPDVSSGGKESSGEEYWQTFLSDPPIVMVDCHLRT